MLQQITFTSSLPAELMDFIQQESKARKCTKKTIIIEALKDYKVNLKKTKLSASFKRAAQDQEQIDLAEFGLEDYLK